MRFARLRGLVSGQATGVHFAAVIFMGPLAALAILALRELHLVSPTPIWLIPVILVVGQLITTATGLWRNASPNRLRLHVWIGSQAMLVTATSYATGWGPALAIGLVLVGQEALAIAGSSSERVILGWTLGSLATGETLVALHVAPSLIPVPEVHGLAVLMGLGIAFSYRSLRTALIEREHASALTEQRERRFRALVQSSSDLVFAVDINAAVTYASPSCVKVLGYEPDTLLQPGAGALVHADDLADLRANLLRIVALPGDTTELSVRVRHADGTWRWLEGVATNLLRDPAVEGLVINARDVTHRRIQWERQTATSDLGKELLWASTLQESLTSAAEVVARMLDASACRISLLPFTESGDHSPLDVIAPSGVELVDADRRVVHRVAVGDPEQPLATIEIVSASVLPPEDEQFVDSVAGIVLSAMVRFGAEDAIRHQALHDPLTGLPNRTLFNDRLEHALERAARSAARIAVMIVDLDGFKNVNDSLGHIVGDALLIAVAERLRTGLRGFDTIARLGGDEFAVLFDELETTDQVEQLAQRILDSLSLPLALGDRDVTIGASIGIAMTDVIDSRSDRLLADADAAMYRAKKEGKGCYRLFETTMHTAAVERMSLEQELRVAIRNGVLTVFYQPIVDTATGLISSFEALARWQHPTRGFVTPNTFIPLAEESGLIIELGRMVLFEACQQAQEWRTAYPGSDLSVAVNVSSLQLASPGLVADVTGALARADVDPTSLIIEVTESILASESSHVLANLNELRRRGIRIAIDDFGTGYSSFAALTELPIDILKIDKRFIDNLVDDEQGRGFVTAIMQLAQTLNLQATAEGVEHEEQRRALLALGCSHIQGFLFSPPMAASATFDYLAANLGLEPLVRSSDGRSA